MMMGRDETGGDGMGQDRTFKFDFPGNSWLAAFAILAMLISSLDKSGSSKRISLLFLARKCARRGKCISTNPPSSAFSPFGDWGSHIYFFGEKNKKFSSSLFIFFDRFSAIWKFYIHISWASSGFRLKDGKNANFRRMQYLPQSER